MQSLFFRNRNMFEFSDLQNLKSLPRLQMKHQLKYKASHLKRREDTLKMTTLKKTTKDMSGNAVRPLALSLCLVFMVTDDLNVQPEHSSMQTRIMEREITYGSLP